MGLLESSDTTKSKSLALRFADESLKALTGGFLKAWRPEGKQIRMQNFKKCFCLKSVRL